MFDILLAIRGEEMRIIFTYAAWTDVDFCEKDKVYRGLGDKIATLSFPDYPVLPAVGHKVTFASREKSFSFLVKEVELRTPFSDLAGVTLVTVVVQLAVYRHQDVTAEELLTYFKEYWEAE